MECDLTVPRALETIDYVNKNDIPHIKSMMNIVYKELCNSMT